jgi:hypothetical protein
MGTHVLAMKQLGDVVGSIAIVVSSCDAFFDCWRPFAFFFRKFWGDCPFPVYLIVNQLRIRSAFLRAIAVGEDRGWASNLQIALPQIREPHVLYFQDDYFLNAPIQRERLAADFAYALEHKADAFCFRARSDLEAGFQPINDRFGVVPRDSDGRTRCQVTLWKRDALLSVLRTAENAWEMESRGSERTREMLALSYSSRENAPIPYLMSAIVRGLWTPEALLMCKQNNLRIATHFRGKYSRNSLLRKLRRARTRLHLPFELARAHRRGILDLDAD